jgi:hypothetical protein
MRGKFMFVLWARSQGDGYGGIGSRYLADHQPALEGAICFTRASPEADDAAFVNWDGPLSVTEPWFAAGVPGANARAAATSCHGSGASCSVQPVLSAENSKKAAKAGFLMRIRVDSEDAQLWDESSVWDPVQMLVGYASGAQVVSQDNLAGLKWEKTVCPLGTPVRCNPVTADGRCSGSGAAAGLNPDLLEGDVPTLQHLGDDVEEAIAATLWDPYAPMRLPLLCVTLAVAWLRGWNTAIGMRFRKRGGATTESLATGLASTTAGSEGSVTTDVALAADAMQEDDLNLLSWPTAWLAVFGPALIGVSCGVVLGWSLTMLDTRLKHLDNPGIPMPLPLGLGPHQLLGCLLIIGCYSTADDALRAAPPDEKGRHWLRWVGACLLLASSWSLGVVMAFGAMLMGA